MNSPHPVPVFARLRLVKSLPSLLFVLLLLLISLSSLRQKSLTVDEIAHLTAGYTYLKTADYRLSPDHPPLVKMLAGLGVAISGARLELTGDPEWIRKNPYGVGQKFFHQWNDADTILWYGRAAILLVTLLLGIGVYCCAVELYGVSAGCLALLLYLLNPDLLAHGQLVTTDMGATCTMFLATYTFWRALERVSIGRVILAALLTGAALATKFTAILLFPILGAIACFRIFSGRGMDLVRWGGRGIRRLATHAEKVQAVMGMTLAIGVISLVVIWACYGFRHDISPDPTVSGTLAWHKYWDRPEPEYRALHQLTKLQLVPEGYLWGFVYLMFYARQHAGFLMGEKKDGGWWHYFLVTFLIKTPIPLILLILLAIGLTRKFGAGGAEIMLLIPVIILLAVAIVTKMNIGHRHILPIYPFMIVFVAKLARPAALSWRGWMKPLLAVLLVWHIGVTAFIYPHFLSYFNEFIGGPANGYKWLVDSNLDWGQDLKGLAEYRRQHSEGPFYLSYFGTASPAYYGMSDIMRLPSKVTPPENVVPFGSVPSGAIVAVSATNLQGMLMSEEQMPGVEEFMRKLRSLEPIANIGYSIFIYRMP